MPTSDQGERPELTFWDTLGATNSMQYTPAIVRPMGERLSAWWIIAQLMRRMDLSVPEHVPDSDRIECADGAVLANLMLARCSFEELADARAVTRPLEFPATWVDRHIERIGGWRPAPAKLLDLWKESRQADAMRSVGLVRYASFHVASAANSTRRSM